MTAYEIIEATRNNLYQAKMLSSAELCLKDAESLLRTGDEFYARRRAMDALCYCVGVFSPIYQRAVYTTR